MAQGNLPGVRTLMLPGFKELAASVEDPEPESSMWYQNLNPYATGLELWVSSLPREVRHAPRDGPVPLWLPACGPLGLWHSLEHLSPPATKAAMVHSLVSQKRPWWWSPCWPRPLSLVGVGPGGNPTPSHTISKALPAHDLLEGPLQQQESVLVRRKSRSLVLEAACLLALDC